MYTCTCTCTAEKAHGRDQPGQISATWKCLTRDRSPPPILHSPNYSTGESSDDDGDISQLLTGAFLTYEPHNPNFVCTL